MYYYLALLKKIITQPFLLPIHTITLLAMIFIYNQYQLRLRGKRHIQLIKNITPFASFNPFLTLRKNILSSFSAQCRSTITKNELYIDEGRLVFHKPIR